MQHRRQQQRTYPASIDSNDSVLAQNALAGDERAFEDLLQRYQGRLFAFVYRHLEDEEQTKDVLQAVFLQLYLSLPKLYSRQLLQSWLFIVARNRCVDELRKRRKSLITYFSELEYFLDGEDVSLVTIIPDTYPLPEEIAEQEDLRYEIQQAIDALPQMFRSVVILRSLEQLSFKEIGHRLNISEATAKTYWHRARHKLKILLPAQEALLASVC